MTSARVVALWLLLSGCAGPSVDSPSASCRTNPATCPNALLVDDAAEAGMLARAAPPPPLPTPPSAVVPAPSPGLVTKLVPLAPLVVVSRDSKAPETIAPPPEIEAAKKPPSKPKPATVKNSETPGAQPKPGTGGGRPPGEPPCEFRGSGGPGPSRPHGPPTMRCTYLCGDQEVKLTDAWGTTADHCLDPGNLERAVRKAAAQRRMKGR